jgi:hypothetical protein
METSLRRLPDWDADLMIYHSSIDLALHATAGDSQPTSYKWRSVVLSSPRLLTPARVETRICLDYRGGRIAPPLPATSRTTSSGLLASLPTLEVSSGRSSSYRCCRGD